MSKNILVIAAHPDDEVLGCGGTIARYTKEGHNCYVVILAEGVTSRDDIRDPEKRKNCLLLLEQHTNHAAEILGARSIELNHLPDNRMDSVDILDVIKIIEKAIDRVKPDIIFTHHFGDLNIDHRITARAVETATRPGRETTVPELYSFEILSSTEWNFSNPAERFSPNFFIDINDTLELKIQALKIYTSELGAFPFPRSKEAVVALAKMRGSQSGLLAAEAFSLIRKIF